MGVAVLVGTQKGLFVLTDDETRRDWSVEGPHLTGFEVFHAMRDPRTGTLHAATNNWVYGATTHRSSDQGETWERAEGIGLPEESGLSWEKSWHVEPGHADEPETLWLGGTPAALFRSGDGGATWEPVRSLLEHPTREKWNPGAGGLCCHSIQMDPSDPQRVYIAISAAGAFRSDDGGDSWERLEGNGLPSGFGFPIALDPDDPDAAWVVPEEGAENRVTPNGRLGI